MGDILKAIAPGIATALGGPLAGAAVSFLAGKFGTPNTAADVQKALEGFSAADIVQMKTLDNDFKMHMADLGIQLDTLQIGVNQTEAANTSIFVAGWRPFIGWVGGIGLAYAAIGLPLAEFVSKVCFNYTGAFPVFDTGLLAEVVFTLLGMGAMRSFDKTKGTDNGH